MFAKSYFKNQKMLYGSTFIWLLPHANRSSVEICRLDNLTKIQSSNAWIFFMKCAIVAFSVVLRIHAGDAEN